MRREIRRRRADGYCAVWQKFGEEGASAWQIIGVFSEFDNAMACMIEGPVWPWHEGTER